MKLYVVIAFVKDWGASPSVFSSMKKAQDYIKRYIAEELLVRLDNTNALQDFINSLEVEYDEDETEPDIINVWFSDAEYLTLEEVELDVTDFN